jgi:hypothetical protein
MRLSAMIILLLSLVGCSSQSELDIAAMDSLRRTSGIAFPQNAKVVSYQHKHAGPSECSELWIIQSPEKLPEPDRRNVQSRSKSPAKSLKMLIEELTGNTVTLEKTNKVVCEYIEWRNGETICRMRQIPTADGWFAAMEAISPQ